MPPRRPQGYLGGFSAFLGSPHPVFWVVPIGRVCGQPLADPCQHTIDTFDHAAAFRVRVATACQPMRMQKLTAAHVRIKGRLAIRASWADRKSTRLNSSHVKISYAV